jgi:tetratricopeptide (TPR) repeat protein
VLEDAELLSLFGKCHIQLNRLQSAEKPLEKAISLAPGNLENYRVLADLLRRLDRDSDADYWMSEAVNANRDSFEAIRMRGEYRAALVPRAKKTDAPTLACEALADAIDSVSSAVEQAVDKADSAAPSSPLTAELKAAFDAASAVKPPSGQPPTPDYRDRLLETARKLKAIVPKVRDAQKELDGVRDALALAATCEFVAASLDGQNPDSPHLQEARIYGTALVELFPAHSPAYLTLAEVEQQSGHADQAIEWLRRGSLQKDTRPMVLWQLAYSLIVAGRLDEARQVIKDMADEGSPETFLVHLQAMIHYSEGNWLLAKEGFERALPQLEAFPQSALRANLLIAECCQRLGLVDQQRAALMRATSLDVTSVDVLLNLASLEMESGQLEEAIEDFGLVLRLRNAPPAAYVGLAQALLAKNLGCPRPNGTGPRSRRRSTRRRNGRPARRDC